MYNIKEFTCKYENLKNECDIDGILKLCENTLNDITKYIDDNNKLCKQELIIIKCLMESIRIIKNPHIYFELKIDKNDVQKLIIELFPEVSSNFIKNFIKDCKEDTRNYYKNNNIYLHSISKNRLDFKNIIDSNYLNNFKLVKPLIHKGKTYICKDTKNTNICFTITNDIPSDDILIPFGIIKKGSDIIDYIFDKIIQNLEIEFINICEYGQSNRLIQYSGYQINKLTKFYIAEAGILNSYY